MGHRALVAYERGPDTYDVHYSHWGAARLKLKHKISEETPFADGEIDRDVWDGGEGVSLETIKDEILQYGSHEAFYIVSQDFEVTAWGIVEYTFSRYVSSDRPNGYDPEIPDTGSRARGVCFPVRWYDGEPVSKSQDFGRIRGYVESAAHMLETEHFETAEEAVKFVHGRVRGHFLPGRGGGSTYDDPLISSEESVPIKLRADTQSLSNLMTDGGRDTGQQSLGDY